MIRPHVFAPLLAFSLSLIAVACNTPATSTPTDAQAATDSLAPPAPAEENDSFVDLYVRLTRASKKYSFKDKEMFDRCSAVEMFTKAGAKVSLPKAVEAEMNCVGASFGFFKDRFIVYTDNNKVSLYDIDSKRTVPLFANFEGVQSNCMGLSPDGTRLLFVNVLYTTDDRKKTDYTEDTRIVLLTIDPTTLAVTDKKKFDRKVAYYVIEGDMVLRNDCYFVSNHAFAYRPYVKNDGDSPNPDTPVVTEAF